MDNKVRKNSIYSLLKTFSQVVFPLITFPYISRVLHAENVGKVNFGNSIISYVSLAASLGITTYAVRECSKIKDDKKKLENMVGQIISLNMVTTFIAYIGLALALLDVMLPDMDGFTLCRKIREKHLFPIIMLTAKTEDVDKITGLTLGADDYITKPFNPLEVIARVKTQLRRYIRYNQTSSEPAPAAVYDSGGLYIDYESHEATLYGKPLSLTPLEFEILWYLCSHKGHVVSSEELFEAVWGEKYLDNNNTVMAHIARLRGKMGEPPRKPRWIKTVWGVGYKIDE